MSTNFINWCFLQWCMRGPIATELWQHLILSDVWFYPVWQVCNAIVLISLLVAFSYCNKHLDNQFVKRKGWFGLRVLEVLVHGQLALLLWLWLETVIAEGCGKKENTTTPTAGKQQGLPFSPSRLPSTPKTPSKGSTPYPITLWTWNQATNTQRFRKQLKYKPEPPSISDIFLLPGLLTKVF